MMKYVASAAWLLCCAWMFTWSMPLSALLGLAFLAACWWRVKARKWIVVVALLASPALVWNIGLVEYANHALDLHCRVLGYASKSSGVCKRKPLAVQRGRDHESGPLFGPVEQLGVHGFNALLAAGGLLAGLPEVAWETLYMSFADDPVVGGMSSQPKSVRLKQCVGGSSAQKRSVSEGSGDFMLGSSTIRKLVARHVPAARKLGVSTRKKLGNSPVAFASGGGDNNSFYGALLRSDNLRVPLTLVVPDGHIAVTGQGAPDGNLLHVRWEGTISYPHMAAFVFRLPTVWQLPGLRWLSGIREPLPVLVSESIFCGMTMDGAMNVYTQAWTTTARVDDPRLSVSGVRRSRGAWVEPLLGLVL